MQKAPIPDNIMQWPLGEEGKKRETEQQCYPDIKHFSLFPRLCIRCIFSQASNVKHLTRSINALPWLKWNSFSSPAHSKPALLKLGNITVSCVLSRWPSPFDSRQLFLLVLPPRPQPYSRPPAARWWWPQEPLNWFPHLCSHLPLIH